MAQNGFNVCIVGRNEGKIKEKLDEIQEKHPTIKTRAIVFDFAALTKIEEYKELIGDALKDVDIAMLYLNAGLAQIGAFTDITDMDVHRQVSVNAVQPIYCTKVLID